MMEWSITNIYLLAAIISSLFAMAIYFFVIKN